MRELLKMLLLKLLLQVQLRTQWHLLPDEELWLMSVSCRRRNLMSRNLLNPQ